jgi:hypothetical protein
MTVVEAVADAERVEPVELPTPLADAINPDALDSLFQNGTGRVSFDYSGYEITVEENGTVKVTPLEEV